MPTALVLWDIGGTLIGKSKSGLLRYEDAAAQVLSLAVPPPLGTSGGTEFGIIVSMLTRVGLSEKDARLMVEPVLAEVEELAGDSSFLARDRDRLPGVVECLATLREMGLYQTLATGNSRKKALHKLTEAGVERFIDMRSAGFGDRSSDRARIIQVARMRAGIIVFRDSSAFSNRPTIVIGDTASDVDAARRCGALSVGVATGTASLAELEEAGATLAVDDLEAGLPAIVGLLLDLTERNPHLVSER